MAEGVVMFDAEGEIVVLNPPARKFLGLSQHQEFSTESFFRSIAWKEMGEFLAMPLGEDGAAREFTTNGHNGMARTFSIEMMPVKNETDRRLGRVGIIRDITAERELEQMKSDFVAVVSHELRTPLSSIKMLVSNLLDGVEGELGEGHRASLTRVTNNVDRLSRLINDLLDLAKLESGKVQVKFKPMHVPHSLQSILENFKCAAQEKRVALSLSASDLPVAWVDADKFEQLVTNLVSNAMKFAPGGGHVNVSASVRPLDTPERIGSADGSPLSGEGYLVVTVQDDGPGIPDSDLERVFDKFYQVDHSMTRKTGGTGLGLPICREIVSKHGGRIWAQNAPSGGAVFTFELPLDARKHDRAALQGAMEREIRRARRYGTPFSVLMIDVDDFTLFNEHHGYPVGDVALMQLHEMLKEEVKKLLRKKIRETDIVGRFGGDEFVVIAPETDDAGVRAFAERLRKLLTDHVFEISGQQLRATMSTGVAAFTDEVDAPITMLRRSAEALATAKRTGKNRVS